MSNSVSHFAIEADDVERARAFYESVFGWRFKSWGRPGFYMIRTGTADDPGLQGALQHRREPLEGTGNRGFECTIGVDCLDEIERALKKHGVRITMPRVRIDNVGDLIYFEDTEGNRVGAMQYHPSYNFRGD